MVNETLNRSRRRGWVRGRVCACKTSRKQRPAPRASGSETMNGEERRRKGEAEGDAWLKPTDSPLLDLVGRRRQADDQARQETRLRHQCRIERSAAFGGSEFRPDRGRDLAMLYEMGITVTEGEDPDGTKAKRRSRPKRMNPKAANWSRSPARDGRRDANLRTRRSHR